MICVSRLVFLSFVRFGHLHGVINLLCYTIPTGRSLIFDHIHTSLFGKAFGALVFGSVPNSWNDISPDT